MTNNRNIQPHHAVRVAEIEATAAADGITLPLSPYVIAVAEDDGWVVDLVTGEASRDDAAAWPVGHAGGNDDEQ